MAETTRHRLAYDAYVKLGAARSLEALRDYLAEHAIDLGFKQPPHLRTLFEWSRRYHWQDRLAELEREARRRDEEEQLSHYREMQARHAREGLALQRKGVERLTQCDPKELSPRDAIEAVARGIAIERAASGQPTSPENAEDPNEHPLAGLSIAELRAVIELVQSGPRRDREEDGPPR